MALIFSGKSDAVRWRFGGDEILSHVVSGGPAGCEPTKASGRNGPGIGLLEVGRDGRTLRYRAPGSKLLGPPVQLGADGEYRVEDGLDESKWLRVQVTGAYLNPSASAEVEIRDVYNNGASQADVTAPEATAGDVLLYAVDLENATNTEAVNTRVWFGENPDFLELGPTAGGPWSQPLTEDAGLVLGRIAPLGFVTVHLRRTIPPAQLYDPRVTVDLQASFDSI